MSTIEVQITNEHLNTYSKAKCIKALSELIWNSLDADSTLIKIEFDRNSLGTVQNISIEDNGVGITYSKVSELFGRLGASEKMQQKYSENGRKLHGKYGHGRFFAFSIGRNVKWTSYYDTRSFNKFEISASTRELTHFSISEPTECPNNSTGVTVEICDLVDSRAQILSNTDMIRNNLTTVFASYLLAYPEIEIVVDGVGLSPESKILNKFEKRLEILIGSELVDGIIKVVEWKEGTNKNLYLCSAEGISFEEESSGVRSGLFSHTAYLQSTYIEGLYERNQLDLREMYPPYVQLHAGAEEFIRELYRERLINQASTEVRKLREEEVYPYEGTPKNLIEGAERQVFDICAVHINQLLPDFRKSNKDTRQLTYRLLKEALQTNPTNLTRILREVLKLPSDQQYELASLLERTSLESIISTTKQIMDRLAFLNGLEEILYDEPYHKQLKERSQLHKILLGELWLFGEHYIYGYDDISLRNVLKKHLNILGRNELIEKIDFNNIESLDDIPDIGLYRQCTLGAGDQFENLVIELKRPSCVIRTDELNQIKRYANIVGESEYFDKEKTKWTFILMGVQLDRFAKREISQRDRKPGLLYAVDNIEVWVKEWNQVIQDAKGRYKFLKDKLEVSIQNNKDGLTYLREKYKKYLPD